MADEETALEDRPDEASDLYSSLPLDFKCLSIRLLSILPGIGKAPLECQLQVARVHPDNSYEALSYTWGSMDRTRPISINGKSTYITTNLEDALKALRLSQTSRKLWVDAVCINQANTIEQPQQILEMGQIFRNAHRVIIWLGKGSEDSDLAIEYMKKRELHCWAKPMYTQLFPEQNVQKGMRRILLAAWWKRVWVVQELSMAAGDPLITFGASQITWSAFIAFINDVDVAPMRDEPDETLMPEFQVEIQDRLKSEYQDMRLHVLEMNDMRIRVKLPPRLRDFSAVNDNMILLEDDLLFWLRRTARFEATRPHDKLFALLGLTRSPLWKGVNVDYTDKVTALMRELVTHQVNAHANLDILTLCHPARSMDSGSWVPDLSVEGLTELPPLDVGTRSIKHSAQHYIRVLRYVRASSHRIESGSKVTGTMLEAKGLSLGHVKHISPHRKGPPSRDPVSLAIDNLCEHNYFPPMDRRVRFIELKSLMQMEGSVPRIDVGRLSDATAEVQQLSQAIFDEDWFKERSRKLEETLEMPLQSLKMDTDVPARIQNLQQGHQEETRRLMKDTLELELLLNGTPQIRNCKFKFEYCQRIYDRERKRALVNFHWRPLWSKLVPSAIPHDQAKQDSLLKLLAATQKISIGEYGQTMIRRSMYNRAQFTTDTGLLGLGPPDIKGDDRIVVFRNSPYAFAIRDKGQNNTLVGTVFVAPPHPIEVEKDFGPRPTDYPANWREPVEETFVLE